MVDLSYVLRLGRCILHCVVTIIIRRIYVFAEYILQIFLIFTVLLLIVDGHLPVYLVAYLVCDMVPSTLLHNTVHSAVYMHIHTKLYRIIPHAQHDTRPRIQI
jgi:hypothetical protein